MTRVTQVDAGSFLGFVPTRHRTLSRGTHAALFVGERQLFFVVTVDT